MRVSYESQRRPRVRVTVVPLPDAERRTVSRAGAGPVTPLFRRRMTLGVLGVLVGSRGRLRPDALTLRRPGRLTEEVIALTAGRRAAGAA